MSFGSDHIHWLQDTEIRITTSDGTTVEVWELSHMEDDETLSKWAQHYRNHYCPDSEIDRLRKGSGYSRAEYLKKIKFPDKSGAPGPSIRAGDFGEILVADYLEFLLGFWVPRTRYADKTVRNESTKGCDIIGFKMIEAENDSNDDTLAVFEAKTQFSGNLAKPRLQDAVDSSKKDYHRLAESLNAIKQRLIDKDRPDEAIRVERFQNFEDRPCQTLFGAAALFSNNVFDRTEIEKTSTNAHPGGENIALIVIRGKEMMNLVHELYRRAADEA